MLIVAHAEPQAGGSCPTALQGKKWLGREGSKLRLYAYSICVRCTTDYSRGKLASNFTKTPHAIVSH